jgi:hypothetical protein
VDRVAHSGKKRCNFGAYQPGGACDENLLHTKPISCKFLLRLLLPVKTFYGKQTSSIYLTRNLHRDGLTIKSWVVACQDKYGRKTKPGLFIAT